MSEASGAIEAATAALRRAAAKSMDKVTIRDKIDEEIRRDNYMKVQEFCRRLEMLGQQWTRRRQGAAWIMVGMRATEDGPEGPGRKHRSSTKLVHNDFLPCLYSYDAGDEQVTAMDGSYDGEKWRSRAPPLYQGSDEGTVTLSHVDYYKDKFGRDRTMGTLFGLREGEEVVVAWHAADMDGEYEEGDTWFKELSTCGSLSVVHAREGDVVRIAEGAWHMVVTVKVKMHLAWLLCASRRPTG